MKDSLFASHADTVAAVLERTGASASAVALARGAMALSAQELLAAWARERCDWNAREHARSMAREQAHIALMHLVFGRREELRGDPCGDRPARLAQSVAAADRWLASAPPSAPGT